MSYPLVVFVGAPVAQAVELHHEVGPHRVGTPSQCFVTLCTGPALSIIQLVATSRTKLRNT
ncbi:hypothetical protein YC2023_098010 [Brassica napus]